MRASSLFRLSGGAAVVGVIVAVALWPETSAVDLATVVRESMRVTVDEEGETRVRDRYVIAAPVSGRLQRVALQPGDLIACKDNVATISPVDAPLIDARSRSELQAAVTAASESVSMARAERDRAAAVLERAAASERRAASLVEAGAVSREDYELAQVTKTAAELGLRAAEHAVTRASAEWQAAKTRLSMPASRGGVVTVSAPAGGVVLRRLRESESVVAAGEPLIEVGDISRIEVVADLLSSDAVRIRAGAPVSIERWGGTQPLAGTVLRIEPSGFLKVSALGVEEQRVNVIIGFDDPAAAAQLGDAYRVDVRITTWQSEGVVTVPVGALFRAGTEWAVFVNDGGRARLQPVVVGERNDRVAQITDGVKPGEQVVLHPPDTVVDGSRVRSR
ncbi:MAG TPA: efflux RND transporter periplasmic adaptor subunit [Vicinamibacterales bacterium]